MKKILLFIPMYNCKDQITRVLNQIDDEVQKYITEVRINQAKRLLEQGGMKVHEVGKEVGYHSSQYFSQAFYKKVGILPGEYMKRE